MRGGVEGRGAQTPWPGLKISSSSPVAAIDDEQAGPAAREDQVAPDDHRLREIAGLGQALAPDDVPVQIGGVQPLARRHEVEPAVVGGDVADALDGEAPLARCRRADRARRDRPSTTTTYATSSPSSAGVVSTSTNWSEAAASERAQSHLAAGRGQRDEVAVGEAGQELRRRAAAGPRSRGW